ncbi:MAG: hypothetical protein DRP00_03790 [Candidatus Aenigmatarchaeota archaeon]|nr:MAG: hypothetical protein DRP00_03790 [Candidatus Aenigmarchaeota archaeon]
MKLRVKLLGISSGGKPIVILNSEDAEELGIKGMDRVVLKYDKTEVTAIVNLSSTVVSKGEIGVYEELDHIRLKEGKLIEVEVAKFPKSLQFIKNKLAGRKLSYEEMEEIVKDVIRGNLTDIEIASFVVALHAFGLDLEEAANLSLAMVNTGEILKLKRKIIADKHCLPFDIPVIVKSDEVRVESIGAIVEEIFKKCSPREIVKGKDWELTTKNLNLQVLTFDDEGNVKFAPVSAVFRVKSPPFLEEITLVGNRKIVCTPEHTIFVLRKGRIINLPAREIKVGDYIVVPCGYEEKSFLDEISLENLKLQSKNPRKFPKRIKITKELMRLLGYYVAEGFTNFEGVFLNFGSHEKELVKDSIECVKKVFNFTPTINYPHKTAVRVCLYSRALSEIFSSVIKAGSNSSNKRIPKFIFRVKPEMKLEFLKALFKGDGYLRRGYESIYVTISKGLAIDLAYLLSLLGISISFSERKGGIREFPIKDGKHLSKTKKLYYIYTQAREIFGGRKNSNVAFINLLPLREIGEIDTKKIGWKLRQELKRNKYITKEKIKRIIDFVKSDDVKKLITKNLSVLKVKKRRKVRSTSKYVYDFKVDGYDRFIAGTAPICIHNSIGGAVGDKTSLLLVPIVAAAGLTIPKTSSRAITSACGTADRAECLMPVDLSIEEMKKVVEKTNGCIVWGGALHLAPADDIFIRIEHPLEIDPLLFPSIMAKKKAVGATHLVIDIPCGRGTKVKTIGDANLLAKDFIELGRKLGIKTQCAITYGEQPIGYAIGPTLEAREALEVLAGKNVPDLMDKVCNLARILFKLVGKKADPLKILKSGKAEKKLREIIGMQGGDERIKAQDIEVGGYKLDVKAEKGGLIFWIDNHALIQVARAAGSPKDKGAGLLVYKKIGEKAKKGEKLFTIFAEKRRKLRRAEKILKELRVFGIGKRNEMLIQEVKEIPVHKKVFILER